jgi:polyhydroxyalkanoate synthase
VESKGSPGWEDLFYQVESATGVTREALQRAYSRTVASANAVAKSLEIPVGLTPKELVWTLNKTRLYRYRPTRAPGDRRGVPLLLVYALINKPFIYDLIPGRSFVEYLLDQGYDIYLLDWGYPGPEDRSITFDDYVTEYLRRAVRKVLRLSGADEITMLGYCLGATLAVTYAALYPEAPVRNLVLLAAPLDFSGPADGSMAVWLGEDALDVDKLVDSLGNVPGELIRHWAKVIKPVENFVGVYVNLWKLQGDEAAVHGWQAINRWVEDVVPVSGEAFRQFVKQYVRQNRLVRNEHTIDGRRVNMANINSALLNVVAKYDHLVSYNQAASLNDLVSSVDKELKVIPSTHVGLMISHRAKDKLWPEVSAWLGERSG